MDLSGVAGARTGINTTSKGGRVINLTPATAAPRDRTAAGPPDSEVIRRSQDEPDLFAMLFRRYAAGLGRYVTRRLGPDLAQDIVAETFLAAFRQRGGYDTSRQCARPWLYGIAANLIRRHYRDEERMLRALERTGIDPVAESAADHVEARLAADATSRAVAAALASLSPGQRDVVLLVTWAELTYDQVAEALGIPEGTVRSRMNRARLQLRAALGGFGPATAFDGQE
jgi:RNA polymerase sigma factor (sigma-70 family)